MEHFTTDNFIKLLQNNNTDMNVSISWNSGDEITPPNFHFFTDVDSTYNWFTSTYTTPFILSSDEPFTRNNSIVSFDDDKLIITFVVYKYDSTHYKFDNSSFYYELKSRIIPDTITWKEYEDSFK